MQLGVMVFKRSVVESRTKNKSILRTKSKPTVKDSIQVWNLCMIQVCSYNKCLFRVLLGRGRPLRSCLVKCSSGGQHNF